MAGSVQLDNLKDLFYHCSFNKLLRVLETIDSCDTIVNRTPDLALLKANSYFELHQIDKAVEVLQTLTRLQDDTFEGAYTYALARLSYFDNDLKGAYELFLDLLESTDEKTLQFKALLGMANVLYSNESWQELEPVVFDLQRFEPLESDDEKISLMLFLGNYHCQCTSKIDEALKYFKNALHLSSKKGWSYFICRSIYGQASYYERAGKTSEMNWTLDMLRSFIDENESKFFSHIVNKKFEKHSFSIKIPMEFDPNNRRILIEDHWLAFHDKPLLYRFLEVLHGNDNFVSKEIIANQLWPSEEYKSRVHDPRIFDIAKRVRGMVEKYQRQPIVLLSGRLGYKLACA
ncbi:MAG: hypothetical protein R3B45_07540 [Bdellovibrionota bacterium]